MSLNAVVEMTVGSLPIAVQPCAAPARGGPVVEARSRSDAREIGEAARSGRVANAASGSDGW